MEEMLVGALMTRLHISCKFRAQMTVGKLPKIETQCISVQIGDGDHPYSTLLHKSPHYPTFLLRLQIRSYCVCDFRVRSIMV